MNAVFMLRITAGSASLECLVNGVPACYLPAGIADTRSFNIGHLLQSGANDLVTVLGPNPFAEKYLEDWIKPTAQTDLGLSTIRLEIVRFADKEGVSSTGGEVVAWREWQVERSARPRTYQVGFVVGDAVPRWQWSRAERWPSRLAAISTVEPFVVGLHRALVEGRVEPILEANEPRLRDACTAFDWNFEEMLDGMKQVLLEKLRSGHLVQPLHPQTWSWRLLRDGALLEVTRGERDPVLVLANPATGDEVQLPLVIGMLDGSPRLLA